VFTNTSETDGADDATTLTLRVLPATIETGFEEKLKKTVELVESS
jgi:hypothetical protein